MSAGVSCAAYNWRHDALHNKRSKPSGYSCRLYSGVGFQPERSTSASILDYDAKHHERCRWYKSEDRKAGYDNRCGSFVFKPVANPETANLKYQAKEECRNYTPSDKCQKVLMIDLDRDASTAMNWATLANDFVTTTKPAWAGGHSWNPAICNPCASNAVAKWNADKPYDITHIYTKLVLGNGLRWHVPCSMQSMKAAIGMYASETFQLFTALSHKPVDYTGEGRTLKDPRYGYVVKSTIARVTKFPGGNQNNQQKGSVSHWVAVIKISCDRGCSDWLVHRQLVCSAKMEETPDPQKQFLAQTRYGCTDTGCICSTPLGGNGHWCPFFQGTCNPQPPHRRRSVHVLNKIDSKRGQDNSTCSATPQYRHKLRFVSATCKGHLHGQASLESFIMQ